MVVQLQILFILIKTKQIFEHHKVASVFDLHFLGCRVESNRNVDHRMFICF